MTPKNQRIYSLHYDDLRGDALRPPHGTTSAAVKIRGRISCSGESAMKSIRIKSTLTPGDRFTNYLILKIFVISIEFS